MAEAHDPDRNPTGVRLADRPSASDAPRLAAFVALAFALAYFTWRGILRGWLESGDFGVAYSAGAAWLDGTNPYEVRILQHHLSSAGGAESVLSQLEHLRNVFAPTTLPLFAPLAWLPWAGAHLAWLTVNVGSTLVIAGGIVRMLGWSLRSIRAIALSAFVLALAPVHSTLATGQTGLAATAALVLAFVLQRRSSPPESRRPILVALLFALATALKLQIGLPFLVYLAWRRWRTAALAGSILLALTVVGVARMVLAGVDWLPSWSANLVALSGPGGINDPGPLNPERFSLINLQILLFDVIGRDDVVNLLTLGLVGAAGLSLLYFRREHTDPDLLAISIVSVLALLVAYHRYYDAVLLAFPVAWAIASLGSPLRREAIAVLVLSADFLFPFQTALHDLAQGGRLPTWLTGSPLWEPVLLSQHVWALVLLAYVLLIAAARARAMPVADQSSLSGSMPS